MTIETRLACHPADARTFDTTALRRHFLIERLFAADAVTLTYSHDDRMVVGGAVPVTRALPLEAAKPLGTAAFLARRELGTVNIGGPGRVTVGGTSHPLGHREALYVGREAGEVSFASDDPARPAKFYLVSAPSHAAHPTRKIALADARSMRLGTSEQANVRTIYQLIVPDVCASSQLCLGMTVLEPGSLWNTMPCHVHDRRSEVYLYFGLAPSARVFHMMGEPTETRHLVVADEQAVISPGWSVHTGVGTSNYTFIWAMAGDNQDYTDMDMVAMEALR